MVLTTILHGSAEYQAECALRDQVLRVPLGLSLYDENLVSEKNHEHFGLFDSTGQIIACLVVVPLSAQEAKLRQMAVRTEYQGRGFGRQIVHSVETKLIAAGVRRLVLHARCEVVTFYEKLGYAAEGDEFLEVGIPHRRMTKAL
jgi:predicted GNAT family N-acyltransferase